MICYSISPCRYESVFSVDLDVESTSEMDELDNRKWLNRELEDLHDSKNGHNNHNSNEYMPKNKHC